ncbi:hypothetical protein B0H67DRAFT_291491 [Lasiosphaeris hirsuta]|uniref:Uncharacterized protein n=1 Tax=Lasiosphaeris hirsuta TaxID=260670 RepID=A0AA40A901_9PEZI|nr:hypothetical protein B0H67DRAFT_291491 [Lasiosphaeris hirsuta]
MESSFTDAEKRFVLAEMIKASHMDVTVLVNFIKLHDVEPDWMSMQLPGGRNMSQCLRAAEGMFHMPFPPPAISLKRKSVGDLGDHASKKQAVGSPGDSPYAVPRTVSTQLPGAGQPVNIQPRPNGYPLALNAPTTPITPITQNVVLPPRRRGRPPKAESQARQSVSQTAHYQPISPAPIAPSPAPAPAPALAFTPRPHSPAPAYQVWSTTPTEPKSKRKGRPPASDKPLPLEAVPRTVHPTPVPETDAKQVATGSRTEYPDWSDRVAAREQPQLGPARRDLPLPPMNTSLPPPPRSPQPPIEGRMHAHTRETPGTTSTTPTTKPLEPTRQGGHAATA